MLCRVPLVEVRSGVYVHLATYFTIKPVFLESCFLIQLFHYCGGVLLPNMHICALCGSAGAHSGLMSCLLPGDGTEVVQM